MNASGDIDGLILRSAGVPIGAPRPAPQTMPDDASLRRAVSSLEARLGDDDVIPYAAWLAAWEHHWPARFDVVFGQTGRDLARRLRSRVDDPNRYLKLRRIAIENLAGVL